MFCQMVMGELSVFHLKMEGVECVNEERWGDRRKEAVNDMDGYWWRMDMMRSVR